MFTSGGGGGGQNKLVSMAMSEASNLFDKSGASGNKQEVVNGAAMTVMKMMVQSKVSGMMGGGNSGGLSGLMGMVRIFHIQGILSRCNVLTYAFYRLQSLCERTIDRNGAVYYSLEHSL